MFKQTILAITFLVPSVAFSGAALETVQQKASYAFGVDVSRTMKSRGFDLDTEALIRGIREGANPGELALDSSEMASAKQAFQQELMAKAQMASKEAAAKNKAAGKAFLEANKKKEGVITTESGLQYKIIKPGTGKKPQLADTVTTHYRGTVIDGTEFDSSYSRNKPASFPVTGVIKGWTEALQLMKVGAKWELYIPSDLAYGDKKRSEVIQPGSTLIFELELLEIK